MPTAKKPDDKQFRVVADEDMPPGDEDYYEEEDVPEEGELEEGVKAHPANKKASSDLLVGEATLPTVEVATVFSRTRQVEQFEPVKAEVSIREVFPGTLTPNQVADVVSSQFQQVKAQVYLELGLPFDQDDATGRIMESLPGTRVVASRSTDDASAARPARSAQRSAPARGQGGSRQGTAGRPAQGRSQRAQQPATTKELWQELCDFPGKWLDLRPEKEPGSRGPDFRSTQWKNDKGYFLGLWLDSKEAPADEEIPEEGYAND